MGRAAVILLAEVVFALSGCERQVEVPTPADLAEFTCPPATARRILPLVERNNVLWGTRSRRLPQLRCERGGKAHGPAVTWDPEFPSYRWESQFTNGAEEGIRRTITYGRIAQTETVRNSARSPWTTAAAASERSTARPCHDEFPIDQLTALNLCITPGQLQAARSFVVGHEADPPHRRLIPRRPACRFARRR